MQCSNVVFKVPVMAKALSISVKVDTPEDKIIGLLKFQYAQVKVDDLIPG
jgi:hypothetical protein